MRAAVLEEFDQPVIVSEVAMPEPGPGEAVIRIRASGLCATDLKVISGAVPTTPTPHIIGHEPAGEISALGSGVQGYAEGDRVIAGLDVSCGHCDYCRRGKLNYCANLRRLGLELDGSVAEYLLVPAANLVKIPDSISFVDAAPIADAVASPYRAVKTVAGVQPTQTVAVYGLGGLGLSAVQIARIFGAEVIAIARTPERRKIAEDLGAAHSFDPREGVVSERIRELTDGLGVHAFLDFVGIEKTLSEGVLSCRKGGRLVIVGYAVPELKAPMMPMILSEVTIGGSRGSTREELHESVQLVAEGKVQPVVGRELTLDEVNDGLDGLRDGSVIGRSVVTFP